MPLSPDENGDVLFDASEVENMLGAYPTPFGAPEKSSEGDNV